MAHIAAWTVASARPAIRCAARVFGHDCRPNRNRRQIQKMTGESRAHSYQSPNDQYSACPQVIPRWNEAAEKYICAAKKKPSTVAVSRIIAACLGPLSFWH